MAAPTLSPADAPRAPRSPRAAAHRRLLVVTGGSSVAPLAVLAGLNLVDEFDRMAFAVLAPEIRDTFGISDTTIVLIGTLAGLVTVTAALPLGALSDRVRRLRLVAVGAALWSGFTLVAAAAPTVVVLGIARCAAGIGRIINEPVHSSLLADYYKPAHYPGVYAVHRAATPLGLTSALLLGVLATVLPWRILLALTAIPTFLLLMYLRRLPEPPRGATRDGLVRQDLPRVRFWTGAAQVFRVPTLRWLYVAVIPIGLAFFGLPLLLNLFFERVYDYGPAGRGLVTFLNGAGVFAGLLIGQWVCARAARREQPEGLAMWAGIGVAGAAVALTAMVVSPWGAFSAVCAGLVGVGLGMYQPGALSLTALVSPSTARGQAFAWPILFVTVGAFSAPAIAALGDAQGYRLAFAVIAAALAIGSNGLVVAARTARADVAAQKVAAAVPVQPAPEDVFEAAR